MSFILSAPILFFFLGLFAVAVKSTLEIPSQISKFLSIYLLVVIGLKGGVQLASYGYSPTLVITIVLSLIMAFVVPVYSYFILRLRMAPADSAAIAATYGSISAVTFITGVSYLESLGIAFDGFLIAAMALMESPAIIMGIVLMRLSDRKKGASNEENGDASSWKEILREALFNGSILLLLGSLVIGMLISPEQVYDLKPFTKDLFYGMLSLFLLDMGVIAGKRLGAVKEAGVFLIGFGVLMPIFNACLAILLAKAFHFPEGNALLFTLLVASASYIAVPAAMRMSIPKANPGYYVPMALAVTFPVNIIIGIPLYHWMIVQLGIGG